MAVVKERFSKFDQENLQKKIESWRLKCPNENQRRLLQRYSNELTLLDATYKTTKY
jgi:hypothetical protein